MSETLSERYVWAVVRGLPDSQRGDVERELRGTLADMIDARLSSLDSADAEALKTAEKDVLLELGDPDRLAAGYSGKPLYLIGPSLFPDYRRLLKLLLAIIVPIVAAVVLAGKVIEGGNPWATVGIVIGAALTALTHTFFWVTLIFAVIERSDPKTRSVAGRWDSSKLPVIPTTRTINASEVIASVVMLGFLIAFLPWQHANSFFRGTSGPPIPLFSPDLWSFWLPLLMVILAADICFEIVKYRIGRWTLPLATINTVLAVLFAAPAVYLLQTSQLLNPEFITRLAEAGWQDAGGPITTTAVFFIIVLAVWDISDGFIKAARSRAPHQLSTGATERI